MIKRSGLALAAVSFSLLGLLLLVSSEVAADLAPQLRAAPKLELTRCADKRGRGECGRLTVLENPADPAGRKISLHIVRIPALATPPEPDPVFVLVGGPGEAATDLRHRLPSLFRRLNRHRDVVLVDQRGTGKSNPLNCKVVQAQDFSLPIRDSISQQWGPMQECLEGYDADLRFYTTPFFVDDLEAVRRALGYGKINLWGGSYGSRAALVYMRRHPESIRSVVLDSVAPFAIQLPLHALADADESLRRLLAHCRTLAACAENYGDLESKTRNLIRQLNESPRLLELEHPVHHQSLAVHVDGQVLAGLIRLALYQRETAALLPLALDAASREDFRPLMVLMALSEQIAEALSLGLQQTILCAEDIMRPWPELEPSGESILQLDLLSYLPAQCGSWPRGKLPANYFEPVHSDLPVLLLSGELDPVTPPRWGEVAAKTLSNSRHLRVPGGHHIVSHLGCVRDIVERFIESARHDDPDIDCINLIQPLPPFISPAGPAMTEVEAGA